MKKICCFLIVAIILLTLAGCGSEVPTQTAKKQRTTIEQFKALFKEYAKEQNINENTVDMDAFREITPDDVLKETGCQLFKNGKDCEAYLLYQENLYRIGTGFGGFGVVDIATCDFDNDREKELLYTYSWGSGIHRSCLGCFDLSEKTEEIVDIGFIWDDVALKKITDSAFELYTVKIQIEDADFAKLTADKQQLIGSIKASGNKPAYEPIKEKQ